MKADDRERGTVTALALDTSSSVLAAAITRDGRTLDASQSFTERNHSVRAVSDLRELLARNGLGQDDIDLIAVGQGPGSYTGVRIAVTAAKTLAWAWRKPLVGVSSLEATAYSAYARLAERGPSGAPVWFAPLVDARRGQAYSALFRAGADGAWTREAADGIRLIADWQAELAERWRRTDAEERPAAIVLAGELAFLDGKGWFGLTGGAAAGDGAAASTDAAAAVSDAGRNASAADPDAIGEAGVELAPWRLEPCTIGAGAVGVLAERRYRAGETDDVHGFVPNYTQLTEAEANLLKAGAGARSSR